MSKQTRRVRKQLPMARSQRGTMLIISLIVLVAMTLAGIATMRSVDTATIMAGNIAFRQSALNAADQGLQAGFALLQTPSPNSDLTKNGSLWAAPAVGYSSNASLIEPDWTDPNAWTSAALVNGGTPDAAGNVVSFLVQRMCIVANCAAGATCGGTFNSCGSTVSTSTLNREGSDNFRAQDAAFASQPQVHYRITARAVGPRASIAIVQTLAR